MFFTLGACKAVLKQQKILWKNPKHQRSDFKSYFSRLYQCTFLQSMLTKLNAQLSVSAYTCRIHEHPH